MSLKYATTDAVDQIGEDYDIIGFDPRGIGKSL